MIFDAQGIGASAFHMMVTRWRGIEKHRSFRFSALRCLALIVVLTSLTHVAVAKDHTNVIFFLSDDQRSDLLGCAGHSILKTPTIDELAANGVRFENMFVTTSICAASRATMFTGLYERSHKYTFGTPPIAHEHVETSYPALLKKAGYRTGFIGKFGVGFTGGSQKDVFDFFVPINRNPYHKKQADGTTRHTSELAGDAAIRFLKEQDADKPFCLSVSFNAAHAEDSDKVDHYPWPKAVDGMYDDVDIPVPRLSEDEVFAAHPPFMKESMNRDRWYWRWDTKEKFERNLRAYYRMISGLDNVMGRVLSELKDLQLAENTVVIFAGDNGYYAGSRGFAGKWSHYEESLRVPLVIYDPRLGENQRGKIAQPMALNVDIPATILNYAGVKVPSMYQGVSLRPIVDGKTPSSWRTDTFCEHLMVNPDIPQWEGVRGERFVYARYFGQEPTYEYLHDLKADPDQLKNLATSDSHAKELAMMRKRCNELRDELGGPYSREKFPLRRDLQKRKPAKKKS